MLWVSKLIKINFVVRWENETKTTIKKRKNKIIVKEDNDDDDDKVVVEI